jgi:hypothetical protein
MKYIKYFEGFTDERLKDLISNGETYVDKIVVLEIIKN